jgi:plasmid stability protein
METHMKTTLEIDEGVMRALKARAARDGTTMSELVERALRALLEERRVPQRELPPLPAWDGGGLTVDVDDRERLYELFDEEDPLVQEMREWSSTGDPAEDR